MKVGQSGIKTTFLGTYLHNLDDKNRLTLPSKLVDKLNKNIVISKGFDGCLEIRTSEEFNKYSNLLSSLGSTKKEIRIVVRQLLANAIDLEIDTSKRILIPTILLKEANINKNITIIGVGKKIELWDSKEYSKFKNESDKIYEEIAEKISFTNEENI